MMAMPPPHVLLIGTSDPSGGTGLEADQRVLAIHRCYALTATTALTVQDTQSVQHGHVMPPTFLRKQLECVLDGIEVDVVKIGDLPSKQIIEIVVDVLRKLIVSTSGRRLRSDEAIASLREHVLPIASIITLSIPEALLLVRRDTGQQPGLPNSLDDIKILAKQVCQLGPRAVLLRGGHVYLNPTERQVKDGETPSLVVNVFYDGADFITLESAYSTSESTSGIGGSLASAVAANLASKKPLKDAVREACRYVEAGLATSFELGKGDRRINHFHSLQVLPFAPGHFFEYLLKRPDVQPLWKAFTQHRFVRAIGDQSLPMDVFKRFVVQDYLYLTQFARTNALAAYKGSNVEDIAASAQIVLGVQKEMDLHIEYCGGFGISKLEMERSQESQATVAYSRYVLDIGQSGDWLGLQVALSNCLFGYQAAAEWVKAQPDSRREGNRHWNWVDMYGGAEYSEGVILGRKIMERHAANISLHRVEELASIFMRVTEMEIEFWEFDAHLR